MANTISLDGEHGLYVNEQIGMAIADPDLNHIDSNVGEHFDALLKKLAREYGHVRAENGRLLARLARLDKDKQDDACSNNATKSVVALGEWSPPSSTPDPTVVACGEEEYGLELKLDQESINVELVIQNNSEKPRQKARKEPVIVDPEVSVRSSTAVNKRIWVDLHSFWKQSPEQLAESGPKDSEGQRGNLMGGQIRRGGEILKDSSSYIQRFMISPNSDKRTTWDVISIFVLGIDMIMVPMIAFDIKETLLLQFIGKACTIFWTLDVVMSFLTGFHNEGAIEMRPRRVAMKYVRSWFPFDFLVVFLDWVLIVITSSLAELIGIFRLSKVLRFGRVFRALRLFRLVRLLKLPSLLDDLADSLQTEQLTTGLKMCSSCVAIAAANHFVACGWYAIGRLEEHSWAENFFNEDSSLAVRYSTSLHWSLTQFTPAGTNIHAKTLAERCYSICVVFLALIVFSSFVSSITASMNHLRAIQEVAQRQRKYLRSFMQDHHLSVDLSNRITAFARHLRLRSQARVHESQVDVFKVLPNNLKMQLHWEAYQPALSMHPVFFHCELPFEPILLEILNKALTEKSLRLGLELFRRDEEAEHMFFLVMGCLEYFLGRSDIGSGFLHDGDWFCEASLWLHWKHKGQLAAITNSEIISIDATIFRKSVAKCIPLFEACRSYATSFQKHLEDRLRLDTKESPTLVDIFYDHDSALEMSQEAFQPNEEMAGKPSENDSKAKEHQAMRTLWHLVPNTGLQ